MTVRYFVRNPNQRAARIMIAVPHDGETLLSAEAIAPKNAGGAEGVVRSNRTKNITPVYANF